MNQQHLKTSRHEEWRYDLSDSQRQEAILHFGAGYLWYTSHTPHPKRSNARYGVLEPYRYIKGCCIWMNEAHSKSRGVSLHTKIMLTLIGDPDTIRETFANCDEWQFKIAKRISLVGGLQDIAQEQSRLSILLWDQSTYFWAINHCRMIRGLRWPQRNYHHHLFVSDRSVKANEVTIAKFFECVSAASWAPPNFDETERYLLPRRKTLDAHQLASLQCHHMEIGPTTNVLDSKGIEYRPDSNSKSRLGRRPMVNSVIRSHNMFFHKQEDRTKNDTQQSSSSLLLITMVGDHLASVVAKYGTDINAHFECDDSSC